jgi:hypothetical protein
VNCSQGVLLGSYIKASESYEGTYVALPTTFKSPKEVGEFTIYAKYGYTASSNISEEGEIQVKGDVRILSTILATINAYPNPIEYGRYVNITWSSEGANSCTGNTEYLSGTSSGESGLFERITEDKLFRLKCTGPAPGGGTRETSAEVLVRIKKPNASIPSITKSRWTRKSCKCKSLFQIFFSFPATSYSYFL